jgi:BirA family biotin operon repressor/biotin-[acetyl-CoA-carboxylase] ligase
LTSEQLKKYFDARSRNAEIFDIIPSTNTYLKTNRKEAGTLVLAISQSDGHGQYERVFESPASGLYMSICVDYLPGIPMTLAAANAVTDALHNLFGLSCSVKWVNDIMANGRKLCGILSESVFCGDDSYTVIGFGLNIKKGVLSDELSSIAISLEELMNKDLPSDTLGALACEIADNLEKELTLDADTIFERYKSSCITEIPENAIVL